MSDTVRLALLTGGIILIAIAIIAGAVLISQWIRQHSVMKQGAAKAGTGSCIGSGVLIVGSVECNGPSQVFGRIEGDLRASDLLIGNGAHVEGSVIAQDVTVCGRVKGTIRAVRAKVLNGGAVEGDIFHRSLAIDENSLFEGSSRRLENPTDLSSSIDAKGPHKTTLPSIDTDLQRVEGSVPAEWSESTVGPKH
jgi:cytoskeletal protein CcmA (bactofilin family)